MKSRQLEVADCEGRNWRLPTALLCSPTCCMECITLQNPLSDCSPLMAAFSLAAALAPPLQAVSAAMTARHFAAQPCGSPGGSDQSTAAAIYSWRADAAASGALRSSCRNASVCHCCGSLACCPAVHCVPVILPGNSRRMILHQYISYRGCPGAGGWLGPASDDSCSDSDSATAAEVSQLLRKGDMRAWLYDSSWGRCSMPQACSARVLHWLSCRCAVSALHLAAVQTLMAST